MRYQFRQAGFAVHQVSAKRVHDAREIYEAACRACTMARRRLIARLYKEGGTLPWRELDDSERALNAQRHEYELHQNHYQRNQNRLEALLGFGRAAGGIAGVAAGLGDAGKPLDWLRESRGNCSACQSKRGATCGVGEKVG